MDYTKEDLITLDLTDMGTLDPAYGAVPPASVSIDASGITYPYLTSSTLPGVNWNTITIQDTDAKPGTLSLKGEDADIDINGVSLMETLRGIQDRLNILAPDPDMEQEWSELKAIREQYEAKLAECREKSRVWKALQS